MSGNVISDLVGGLGLSTRPSSGVEEYRGYGKGDRLQRLKVMLLALFVMILAVIIIIFTEIWKNSARGCKDIVVMVGCEGIQIGTKCLGISQKDCVKPQ